VDEEKCRVCHEKRPLEEMVHEVHFVKRNLPCSYCHREIEHRDFREFQPFSPPCQRCHPGKHFAVELIYEGRIMEKEKASPSSMFISGIGCTGCHVGPLPEGIKPEIKAKTKEEIRQSCVQCHGENYAELIANWKEKFKRGLNYLSEIIGNLRKDNLMEKKKEALRSISIINSGGAQHNPIYAVEVLTDSYRVITEGRGEDNIPDVLKGVEKNCLSLCHSIIGMPEVTVHKKSGNEFSHSIHVEAELECITCHKIEDHLTGKSSDIKCGDCH